MGINVKFYVWVNKKINIVSLEGNLLVVFVKENCKFNMYFRGGVVVRR